MNDPKKTHLGAAVFWERAADDGWPARTAKYSDTCVRGARRPPLSQRLKSIFPCGKRTSSGSLARPAWTHILRVSVNDFLARGVPGPYASHMRSKATNK